MKYLYIALTLLLLSCSSNTITETDEREFSQITERYQEMYIDGDDSNCDELLDMVDKNIEFNENGATWTKTNMIDYCPYLPKKDVFETLSEQKLLSADLAYDFVNQLYLTQDQDTISETSSRLWKKLNGDWKIIKMNVVRYKITELNRNQSK